MFVNVHHDSPAEHRRLMLCGVVFLTVTGLLVWLSLAIYNKTFENVVRVTIKAERAGLQLAEHGDVRVHGVLVGQVRDIRQDGRQASIEVALQPAAAARIPRNVRVAIIPTTLFGQKFVELVDPVRPASESLADGDVITADRVRTNVELSRVLAELFPLLRSVSPADLNTTLHALATALDGKGAEIGRLMEDLDGYVTRLNRRLPQLREDLVLLADVSETYQASAGDLLRTMRNSTPTMRTLTEEQRRLDTFLGDLTGLAVVSTRVLERNEAGIIRLGQVSEPFLRLLATYSPEYPCLLKGLDRYTDRLAQIFHGGRVHQMMTLDAVQRPVYDAADKPMYGEVGHGPWCLGLPNPPVPAPAVSLRDGSDQEELNAAPEPRDGAARSFFNPTSGYAGTPPEQRLVAAVLASQSGTSASRYSGMSTLLYGPQLRGTEVSR